MERSGRNSFPLPAAPIQVHVRPAPTPPGSRWSVCHLRIRLSALRPLAGANRQDVGTPRLALGHSTKRRVRQGGLYFSEATLTTIISLALLPNWSRLRQRARCPFRLSAPSRQGAPPRAPHKSASRIDARGTAALEWTQVSQYARTNSAKMELWLTSLRSPGNERGGAQKRTDSIINWRRRWSQRCTQRPRGGCGGRGGTALQIKFYAGSY